MDTIWNKAPAWLYRRRRFLYILLALALFGMVSVLVISGHVKRSAAEYILTPEEAAAPGSAGFDCILVLGAGIKADGSPSDMLHDRLDYGVMLYDMAVSDRLLMSGDHSRRDYDEVNTMKRFATERGIPTEAVFMDHAGFSTYESCYRARDVFRAKRVLIVTQEYHLYRALYNARQLGLEAYGVAADPRDYMGQTHRDCREMLARSTDYFQCLIQPEPTFLGEVIAITGNGNLTNG